MDMDGTLLNSASKVTQRTVEVLQRCAEEADVRLLVATGKARPAVVRAFEGTGLVGAPRAFVEPCAWSIRTDLCTC